MDHSEFPPNSHSSKEAKGEEKKKVEPVVTNKVTQRKKTLGKRFKEHFTGPDSVSVLDYMINDLAIPAAKEMFADVVTGGLERRLFGTEAPRGRRRHVGGGGNPYGNVNYHQAGRSGPRREAPARSKSHHDFGEFVLATRAEGEEAVTMMYMLLEQYGVVTVAELYDLLDVSSSFTDHKWGWYDLQGTRVSRARGGGGYVLNLPGTVPLD